MSPKNAILILIIIACVSLGGLFYLLKTKSPTKMVNYRESARVGVEVGKQEDKNFKNIEEQKDQELEDEIDILKQKDMDEYGYLKPETTQKIVDLINERKDEKYEALSEEEKQAEKERRLKIQEKVDAINEAAKKKE
jgi:hypothetical protein